MLFVVTCGNYEVVFAGCVVIVQRRRFRSFSIRQLTYLRLLKKSSATIPSGVLRVAASQKVSTTPADRRFIHIYQ